MKQLFLYPGLILTGLFIKPAEIKSFSAEHINLSNFNSVKTPAAINNSNSSSLYISDKQKPGEGISNVQKAFLQLVLTKGLMEDELMPYANLYGTAVSKNFSLLPDSLKNCGGYCFAVAKKRIDEAYRQVTGKTMYSFISKNMATPYLTAKQSFDWAWNLNTQNNEAWRSIPGMRACGNAGAMRMAGLADFKDENQIWKGELFPGAVIQTYVYSSDFSKVLQGLDNPGNNLTSYGHSFIFLEYVKNENGLITGMRIADQGFMNGDIVIKDDFQLWFGANLLDPK
jgi:hypothetical protein